MQAIFFPAETDNLKDALALHHEQISDHTRLRYSTTELERLLPKSRHVCRTATLGIIVSPPSPPTSSSYDLSPLPPPISSTQHL